MSRLDGEEATIVTIESGVEPRPRLTGAARSRTPYGSLEIASESQRDRKHSQQLARFYRRVAAAAVRGLDAEQKDR